MRSDGHAQIIQGSVEYSGHLERKMRIHTEAGLTMDTIMEETAKIVPTLSTPLRSR